MAVQYSILGTISGIIGTTLVCACKVLLLKVSLFPFHRLCFYIVWCPFWYLEHHQNKASACIPKLHRRWFVGHLHSLRKTFGFLGDDKMYILGPSALDGTQGLQNKQGFLIVFPAGVRTTLFVVQFFDLLGDYLMLDFFLSHMRLLLVDSLSHPSEMLLLFQVHYEALYVERTWIFWLSKLHWKKYLEATSFFPTTKLHWKSMRTWCGNSSKFSFCRIDLISTSNGRGFNLVCPLGSFSLNLVLLRTIARFRECSSIWSILFCISSIFWWSIGRCW